MLAHSHLTPRLLTPRLAQCRHEQSLLPLHAQLSVIVESHHDSFPVLAGRHGIVTSGQTSLNFFFPFTLTLSGVRSMSSPRLAPLLANLSPTLPSCPCSAFPTVKIFPSPFPC